MYLCYNSIVNFGIYSCPQLMEAYKEQTHEHTICTKSKKIIGHGFNGFLRIITDYYFINNYIRENLFKSVKSVSNSRFSYLQ